MGNKRWWSMAVVTVVVAMACSSTPATPAPATAPPKTTAPVTAPPATTGPATTGPATTAPATTAPATATPVAATPTPEVTVEPTTAPALAVPTVPTGYAELDKALTEKGADGKPIFNGLKVGIQTQWIGGEGANFTAAFSDFAAATGIVITNEGIGTSHEQVLKTRLDGNAPPDLAMLAQPSAVIAYGKDGKLADIASFVDVTKFNTEHAATVGLVTDGSNIWGIPYKVDVKSTVWYPIKAFADKGYKVPTTYQELLDLSDQIVADGSHPWCLAIESGGATGWIATDWLEDVVLRTAGIDAYNKWITGELKFNSPEITTAMDDIAKVFFGEGYVDGGTTAITATDFRTAMDPMFTDFANPGCWMQKQATWFGPDFFPDARNNPGTPSAYVVGKDIGIFYFPPIDPAQGTPVLGAGDTLMVPLPAGGADVRPEVMAVAEFLSTPEGTENWIRAGSAISANTTTPAEWYAGAYKLQVAADMMTKATSFGFDASDLMPPAVGAGSEWELLTQWINGGGTNPTTEDVLSQIDASWPATP